MVTSNAFVYLFKYVVGVFLSYTFEEGCGKALFVKGLADLALNLDASFGSLGSVLFNR